MTNKRCSKCKLDKPLAEFYRSSSTKDGHRFECKICSNNASMEYAKAHWKTRIQPKTRGYRLQHRYGLTIQDFDKLILNQKGMCAICHEPLVVVNVDHCHKTGKVRGLLCSLCNLGVGKLRDDINILKSAIEYLNRHGTDLESNS